MTSVPLGDLVLPVASWSPSRRPADEFDYVDLSAVDSQTKTITGAARTRGSEAPSRARQLIEGGDVLVSTVRPNLNSVAVVPPHLQGATASTGFTVLRAGSELDNRYLFHWTRSAPFVSDMVKKATGASYPAVSDRIVKESLIPTPRLHEQRRIAAILDQADAVRAKRRQVLAYLDALTQSIFRDMFGDPVKWPSRWRMTTIGDMADSVQYGTSAKAGGSGEWPILRMGNITDSGRVDSTDLKYLDLSDADVPKYTVRKGDLLFNRTNSAEKVGKAAVVRDETRFALAGYLVRVRMGPAADPEFVSAYLGSGHGKAVRRGMAKVAVNQANISASQMKKIPIALPPIDLQRMFAGLVEEIERGRARLEASLSVDGELFDVLQARAFRGEL